MANARTLALAPHPGLRRESGPAHAGGHAGPVLEDEVRGVEIPLERDLEGGREVLLSPQGAAVLHEDGLQVEDWSPGLQVAVVGGAGLDLCADRDVGDPGGHLAVVGYEDVVD